MFRTIAIAAVLLSTTLLTGCDESAQTAAAPIEQAAPVQDAKKPAFRHGVSARDGYKPRKDLCSIPPCDTATADPAAGVSAGEKPAK